jgi:hypothetical protein
MEELRCSYCDGVLKRLWTLDPAIGAGKAVSEVSVFPDEPSTTCLCTKCGRLQVFQGLTHVDATAIDPADLKEVEE